MHSIAEPGSAVLVIGETPVAQRVCATLTEAGTTVTHLVAPTDIELAAAVADKPKTAAVLIRDDVSALHHAFALAHLDPSLPLVVSIFDKTIKSQLRKFLPQATVVSPAQLAVPSLIGPCLNPDLAAGFRTGQDLLEVRLSADGVSQRTNPNARKGRSRRALAAFRWGVHLQDTGSRLMLAGLAGILTILIADWTWLVAAEGHDPASSFLEAARVVATVGPAPDHVEPAYAVLSALSMLFTIVFTAMFTAGLIDRLLEPRLLGLLGVRTPPRKNHVVVVGMGQVGLRLCLALRDLGVPVVGVERDKHAPLLTIARRADIPVILSNGSDRVLLERLRLDRSLALAAVASDDLENIAVAVTASAVSPRTRVILRAGEQEAIAETRALLPLGTTKDVTEIAASYVASAALGRVPIGVVGHGNQILLRYPDGENKITSVSRRHDCLHN